jgi:hypothetical protein
MLFWYKWKVKHRICCDELGYPVSEAMYLSVWDWLIGLVYRSFNLKDIYD